MTKFIVDFNGFKFKYSEHIIERVSETEYVDIYSNIIVLESNNIKFKINDTIDQISISRTIYFEHENGSQY